MTLTIKNVGLDGLHEALKDAAPLNPVGPIDITGLDKAEVLFALYNGTQPLGLGVQRAAEMKRELVLEDFAQMLAERLDSRPSLAPLYFDYVAGRPLKVDITSDELDPSLYDRDAGQGTAARVIAALRERG